MNRPPPFSETSASVEFKETSFTAPTASLDRNPPELPANDSFQFEWDDFDTGTLDELP